jgi:DASS family divalent anion:Na+ symporter
MKPRLALVFAVGILLWFVPNPEGVTPKAWHLFAIFVATLVGLVSKPLPMGAMALTGIAAALLTQTLTLAEALTGFSNGTVWLVLSAFFIAAGFIKTGLGARLAYVLVSLFGRGSLGVGYSLVATDLVLAPAIPSNTARAGGVVFPILQSIAKTVLGDDPVKGPQTRAFLTLVTYQGTVITSAMFVTSMVANPLIVQLAATQGIVITWTGWMVAALVPGLLSLVVTPLVIYATRPPGFVKTPEAPALARAALKEMGPMKRDERLMSVISVVMIVLWILGTTLSLDPTATAIMAIAALLLTGVLTWEDLCTQREAWDTYMWFAAVVMMATFLAQFGLIKWFSEQVGPIFQGIGWIPGLLGLSLTYFYTHYFFASITAHVTAMYLPFLVLAIGLGAPPQLAALLLAFFSSLFASLTHYGTPPGAILFGGGHVSLGTWWKVGLIVSFVNITIWCGAGALWWKALGLW